MEWRNRHRHGRRWLRVFQLEPFVEDTAMTTVRRHAATWLALLALATVIQVWSLAHAVVPSLDSVRFVAAAQEISREGLWHCWRAQSEQLLFPASISLLHHVASPWLDDSPSAWALCAQWAAAIPLVLLVIPVHLATTRLVSPRGGLIAGLLVCVLSEVARLGADGLSDSTHLFFLAVAWWLLIEAFHVIREPVAPPALVSPSQCWRFLLAGASVGLALLTRSESVLMMAAAAVTLLACRIRFEPGVSWSVLAGSLVSIQLGWALIWIPYLSWVDVQRFDDVVARLQGRPDGEWIASSTAEITGFLPPSASEPQTGWQLENGQPLVFSFKDAQFSSRFHGWTAAAGEFLRELPQVFQYWVLVLAGVGIVARLRRPVRPIDLLAQAVFLLFAAAAYMHAVAQGYLSTRHLLPLLLPGLAWAAQGALIIERRCQRWVQRRWPSWQTQPTKLGFARMRHLVAPLEALGLVAVIAGVACLPKTLLPLHASHWPHRQAARWLETEASPSARVLDTRGWTGLYSGKDTYRYNAARSAWADPMLEFVVLEKSELERNSDRSRSLKHMIEQFASPAAMFSDGGRSNSSSVVVYRWDAQRLAAHAASLGLRR
jgi:hypothetical protein